MNLPIKEQVIERIIELLRGITKNAGYSVDVRTIVRAPLLLPFSHAEAPILFVEIIEEELSDRPTMQGESVMSISIAGGLVPRDTSFAALTQLASNLSLFENDVRKLLGQPDVLGGLVTYLSITRSATDLGYLKKDRAMFALDVEVSFLYSLADPSQRGF